MNSTLSLPGAANSPPTPTSVESLLACLNSNLRKKSAIEHQLQTPPAPASKVRVCSNLTSVPALLTLHIKQLSQINSPPVNALYLETSAHLTLSNNSKCLQLCPLVFASFRKEHSEHRGRLGTRSHSYKELNHSKSTSNLKNKLPGAQTFPL